MKLALLALLLAAPLAAQREPQVIDGYQLASWYGVTVCHNGMGYSFIASNLAAIDSAATRAHEAMHREQYTRFPSCDAFIRYYQTPRGKLQSEAEAYHAGWCVSIRMGADSVSLRQAFIEQISRYFGGEVNQLEIARDFDRYRCP